MRFLSHHFCPRFKRYELVYRHILMGFNVSDRDSGEQVGYPADIAMPDGMGVRNEDLVGDERAATVRGRYLARQSDLIDEQAHALAWRELGLQQWRLHANSIEQKGQLTAGLIKRQPSIVSVRSRRSGLPSDRISRR